MNEIKNQRVVEISPSEARLIVRLEEPENCYLSIAEVGIDSAEILSITSASLGEIENGKVFLESSSFDSENKIKLEVTFDREVIGGYMLTVEIEEP